MADPTETMSPEAAEKAYAEAAAQAVAKADAATPAPLAFPAKPARAVAPKAAKAIAAAKPAAKQAVPAKKPAAARKPAALADKTNPVQTFKETIMTANTTDFTKTIKSVAAQVEAKAKAAATDVQAKAKLVYAKGSEVAAEASELTKGNVDAVVTSGKILGAGLQGLGQTYVAEGKAAMETVTAQTKELVAVKSPSEYVEVQSAILRRNFDHAIDFNTKTSQTVLKLLGDVFAPLQARTTVVVEKFKKAA